jgi:thiol-disulfide isomerase/thioredoxin
MVLARVAGGAAKGAAEAASSCASGLVWLIAVVSVCSALLLGSVALRADEPDKLKLGEFIPAASPQPAPEISVTDMAGKPVSLGDFKGQFVLVNLWATWCQPCLKEMPSLMALQTRLGSALTVLAISEDRAGARIVQDFVAAHGFDKLAIYLDPNSTVGHTFDARGLPTSILIGADGKLLGRVEGGADWDSDTMRDALAKLLPPAKPG